MKFNSFASSADQVSRVGFGAMGLGGSFGQFDERELIHSVLHSLEKGVTFIDTARAYGNSETLVGKALKEWKGERPFIASKVQSLGPGSIGWGMPIPIESAYPQGWIKESTEISLRELGVESIDLIQTHQYWPQWDKKDYWMEELIKLKEEGKVRYIGISIPDQRHDIALSIVESGRIDSVQTVLEKSPASGSWSNYILVIRFNDWITIRLPVNTISGRILGLNNEAVTHAEISDV